MSNDPRLTLQDALQLLDAVVGDAQDAIVIADAVGVVHSLSAAGALSLGLAHSAAVGKNLADVAPAVLDGLQGTMALVRLDGMTRRAPVEWPDGNTFQATVVPAPGLGPLMVFHNASELKPRDWMDLVTVVSHDLKAPLSVLYGYAHMLNDTPELSARSHALVSALIENVDRMHDLIQSLLDLAQIEAGMGGEAEPCDLVKLINNAREMLERQAQDKRQALTFELAPVSPVMTNPVRLTQVIYNLVGNAIKYTPSGGRIRVATEQSADQVRLVVKDNGPGIPLSVQPRLYEKFYRGEEATGNTDGTGLGLAIVKSIVESYGGSVWVESQPGEGSTFGCALPVPPDDPVP